MAVTYIENGVSPGATSISCVIVRPANLAVGNLMIAHVGFNSTDTITAPVVTPAWNSIQDRATTAGRTAIFWKLAWKRCSRLILHLIGISGATLMCYLII
jgi:hypothetical protein